MFRTVNCTDAADKPSTRPAAHTANAAATKKRRPDALGVGVGTNFDAYAVGECITYR